ERGPPLTTYGYGRVTGHARRDTPLPPYGPSPARGRSTPRVGQPPPASRPTGSSKGRDRCEPRTVLPSRSLDPRGRAPAWCSVCHHLHPPSRRGATSTRKTPREESQSDTATAVAASPTR